jgi:hypothetical protein
MADIGLVVTGVAALAAVMVTTRDHLTQYTAIAWVVSLVVSLTLPKPLMPGAWAIVDACLALACLWTTTNSNCREARYIGLISMLLICAHFVYAGSKGTLPWIWYASILNAGFCLQCLVASGGMGSVERIFNNMRGRSTSGYQCIKSEGE